MTCLSAQQAALQAYLLAPAAEQSIVQHIANTERASSEVRLEVYAEAYRLRLQEALSTDFEALHGLLGDTQFEQLCLKYIDAHPSQHFSLRYFGRHMSHFLRVNPPYSTQPVLAELAAFEWALIDAFDAPDSELVNLEDIASLPAEQWSTMCLELHESVRCLELEWNVHAIWTALKEGKEPEAPAQGKVRPWLVWRKNLTSYFRPLSPQEAWGLDVIRNGNNFAVLCEGLCEWVTEEQSAATAAGMLYRWISDGLIKGRL